MEPQEAINREKKIKGTHGKGKAFLAKRTTGKDILDLGFAQFGVWGG